MLKGSFREGGSLPKDKELQILTFGDLESDSNKIQDIYNKLKKQLKSIKNYPRYLAWNFLLKLQKGQEEKTH